MSVGKKLFGMIDGNSVAEFAMTNGCGLTIKCVEYGATIISVITPDRHGILGEISLCYPTLEEIISHPGPYFGCIAGRTANRIRGARFSLNGKEYLLAKNNGENCLHGGMVGFDKKIWKGTSCSGDSFIGVTFEYISEDGEENYPGNLNVVFLSVQSLHVICVILIFA
jgi:aldose 1-epimerase